LPDDDDSGCIVWCIARTISWLSRVPSPLAGEG
jgi:hypothetical protein